jgi:hypothetical protein
VQSLSCSQLKDFFLAPFAQRMESPTPSGETPRQSVRLRGCPDFLSCGVPSHRDPAIRRERVIQIMGTMEEVGSFR